MKIGLLGAARITPTAIIDPARVIPSVKVHGVAARDPERAAQFASEHGIPEVYSSYAELISAPEIDLIYNALPINLHAPWTIRALQAGKHVLCEKPFAMNLREAGEMLAAAEANDRRVIEAFHYRYHPAFKTFLDWIRSGEIGEIQAIEACFDVHIADNGHEIRHMPETGGGAMMDLGCYPLSWTLMAMEGETPSDLVAQATHTPKGVDEIMITQMTYPSGATVHLSSSMAADATIRADLIVKGSKGEIDFMAPIAPHMGGRLQLKSESKLLEAPISPITTYTHQLAAVADALKVGYPLPTEGQAILTQQAMLDRIYAAAGLTHLRSPNPA